MEKMNDFYVCFYACLTVSKGIFSEMLIRIHEISSSANLSHIWLTILIFTYIDYAQCLCPRTQLINEDIIHAIFVLLYFHISYRLAQQGSWGMSVKENVQIFKCIWSMMHLAAFSV